MLEFMVGGIRWDRFTNSLPTELGELLNSSLTVIYLNTALNPHRQTPNDATDIHSTPISTGFESRPNLVPQFDYWQKNWGTKSFLKAAMMQQSEGGIKTK